MIMVAWVGTGGRSRAKKGSKPDRGNSSPRESYMTLDGPSRDSVHNPMNMILFYEFGTNRAKVFNACTTSRMPNVPYDNR